MAFENAIAKNDLFYFGSFGCNAECTVNLVLLRAGMSIGAWWKFRKRSVCKYLIENAPLSPSSPRSYTSKKTSLGVLSKLADSRGWSAIFTSVISQSHCFDISRIRAHYVHCTHGLIIYFRSARCRFAKLSLYSEISCGRIETKRKWFSLYIFQNCVLENNDWKNSRSSRVLFACLLFL